jgi:MFS family permease
MSDSYPPPVGNDFGNDAAPAAAPLAGGTTIDHGATAPSANSGATPAEGDEEGGPSTVGQQGGPNGITLYDRRFWLAYANNLCLMTALSLLFRFADYVRVLCGPSMSEEQVEWHLGLIVGVGMVGSLVARLVQGQAIVRLGARQVWCWSAVGMAVMAYAHLFIDRVDTPAVYLVQIAFRTCVAGAFGASITYISSRVAVMHVPETVGMLGTSGFLGMMLGTLLGDQWIFRGANGAPAGAAALATRSQVDLMFEVATALGVLAIVFALLATRGEEKPQKRRQPSFFYLLRRYHPGMLLLVAVAVGTGISLANTYLRPFAQSLGIPRIATFFWVYCVTAFITRYLTRQAPRLIGVRPMILIGLGAVALSLVLYLPVRSEWHLVFPAIVAGIAHASLFPSVTGGGSISFPVRFRGIGVTLMLAMFDLGTLLGMPLAGGILYSAEQLGLARYPTMFLSMAGLLSAIALLYAWTSRKATHTRGTKLPRRRRKRRLRPAAV